MEVKLTETNYVHKTAADFIRWWQKKDALQKQAAAEQGAQLTYEIVEALMVWEDDGGSHALRRSAGRSPGPPGSTG